MNPLLLMSLVKGLNKRTCQKCKRDQIVSAGKKRVAVSCKFCGAEISPLKSR